MPRIAPIPDGSGNEIVEGVFRGARDLLGRVPNFVRTVSHSPGVVAHLLPLIAALQREGAGSVTPARIKELAVIKTSTLNGCVY